MTYSRLLLTTMLSAGLAGPAVAQSAGQSPAFDGQTQAPAPSSPAQVDVATVAEDLPHLWAVELLDDGAMLVTAKEGAMHVISAEGAAGPAIEGVPEVDASGQGGLLDVALAPDFTSSGMIFFSFAEPRDGGNGTSLASARLVRDGAGGRLEDVKVIFRQTPTYDGNKHYGSRIVVADDHLFLTVGERSDEPIRDQAQDLSSGLGKVFRIDFNGEALPDNPFVGRDGALPEIWSYGHRNLQSATFDGQGRLWTVEHGPKGGDELNRPEAGKNYGWPVITYGVAYSGAKVGEGITAKDGMEQPTYYWDPVIGPSGMAWYEGAEFPGWEGTILVGGLVTQDLVVLHMEGDRVAQEERVALDARIRDVKVAPGGEIIALTESRGGSSSILRLTRAAD